MPPARNLGVHLACALPEVDWLEYSFQNTQHLVATPVMFEHGRAIAPERLGHGLDLSEAARRDHAVATVAEGLKDAPPGPIRMNCQSA